MPTMDGYEFVRRLREDPEIGKIPAIFSTAHYLSRESQALAEKCGVTSIIYKPCEPQVVLDIVGAALQDAAAPGPAARPETEEFDREHQRLLTNKLAEKTDQLRDVNTKLTALIELSTELAQERDPAELLDRYCSVAREVIGARWTLVVLLKPTQKTIQHLGIVGLDLEDSPALRSTLLETGIFRTVISEGRTICLSDVTSTPGALMLPDRLPRAESLLVVPLSMREQVYGWICLADKLGFEAFSEQDQQLTLALAAKMAVAYDNACLYSNSVEYASKLEAEISEREKVERQLGESKARLAGIIDSAVDSIITIDSGQRVLMFNGAAEKMFRCRAAEVIGQSLDRFIPPRFRPNHSRDIGKFGETGVTTRAMGATRAVSGIRADGQEFPMEASISQMQVGGQKLYTVIMRDITERKRAEFALRNAKDFSENLIQTANVIILGLDLEGNINTFNETAEKITGYTATELKGRSWGVSIYGH
jgi:PAS domain S-box-containing protein